MQGKSRNASNPKELHQFPRNSIETLKHWMTGRAVQPMHVSHLLFEEITYLRVLPLRHLHPFSTVGVKHVVLSVTSAQTISDGSGAPAPLLSLP